MEALLEPWRDEVAAKANPLTSGILPSTALQGVYTRLSRHGQTVADQEGEFWMEVRAGAEACVALLQVQPGRVLQPAEEASHDDEVLGRKPAPERLKPR